MWKLAAIVCFELLTSIQCQYKYGGGLLTESLNELFGSNSNIATVNYNSLPNSRVYRRCTDFLACEYPVQAVEIENGIFYNGVLYINNPDKNTRLEVDSLQHLFGGVSQHLPSTLVQLNMRETGWLPGPEIKYSNPGSPSKDGIILPSTCASTIDTSAYFLFPWEANNAYHALNDNILSILATLIIQHTTHGNSTGKSLGTPNKTLFLFKKQGGVTAEISTMFRVLKMLFEGDVRSASDLLTGGPHCVKHLTWGTNIKLFYRDSLSELRRMAYLLMQKVLRKSPLFPKVPVSELQLPAPQTVDQALDQSTAQEFIPRIIIVTRNISGLTTDPYRKLAAQTERALVQAYAERGAVAVVCCDFPTRANTITKLLSFFAHVDICVGIHGAGLTNCVFSPNGVVMFELQGEWAVGFDSFMKIAHMAGGTHVLHDYRGQPKKHKSAGAGLLLSSALISDAVDVTLRLARQARKSHTQQKQHRHRGYGVMSSVSDSIASGFNRIVNGLKSKDHDVKLSSLSPLATKSSSSSSSASASVSENERLSRLLSSSARDHIMQAHLQRLSPSSSSSLSTAQDNSLQSSYANTMRHSSSSNGTSLVRLSKNSKFLITQPPPYTTDSQDAIRAAVLGPLLDDTNEFCKTLPYYEFRQILVSDKKAKAQCDLNIILKKPSGLTTAAMRPFITAATQEIAD